MSDLDDLRIKYKPLSKIEMSDELKERIHNAVDNYQLTKSIVKSKKRTWFVLQSALASVATVAIVIGAITLANQKTPSLPKVVPLLPAMQEPATHQPNQTGGLSWAIPANIAWDGYYFDTKGYIAAVGSQLGVAVYPGPARVYRVPGKVPSDEVAVEVDTLNGKYVLAKRVPLGTETLSITAINWMSLDSLRVDQKVQPGETLKISGTIFYRELYGTTIKSGLKVRQSSGFYYIPQKELQVSQNGEINGQLVIPKSLTTQTNKELLLVFKEESETIPTDSFQFPLLIK